MPGHPPSNDVLALLRATLNSQELSLGTVWLAYFSLGGSADTFYLDAYIHELIPCPPLDRLVLDQACRETLGIVP